MTPDEVAKRLDNRAGYELITFREVGLPIFWIHATALLLERQDRSCIEEFTLRALSSGLDTSEQIQGLLGLPAKIVDTTLADLVRQEAIRTSAEGHLLLTDRGAQLVGESEMLCPSKQTIWFPFDGLLRRPKWYGGIYLSPNEAQEQGLPLIRAIPAKGPDPEELSAADVSEVVRLGAGAKRGERDVLRIVAIERRSRRYLPAVALVYRSLQGVDVQVALAIDGRLSQEHEIAFARGGGLDRQPIFEGMAERVRIAPVEGVLSGRIAALVSAAEANRGGGAVITTSRSKVDKAALGVVTATSAAERKEAVASMEAAQMNLERAESEFKAVPVRPLPVYEHPGILRDAIDTAKRRLLIVSPWVRRAVVDDGFLRGLRQACGRGVAVSIGFGLGEDEQGEKPWDAEARRGLEELSNELPLLNVCRFGDTHAKVLVKDSDFFVITSFNWLSFRGDPSRPFREEWGTMVRDSKVVDEFYDEMLARFPTGPERGNS